MILEPIIIAFLLLMMATGLMALFNRPEGIRPPWWDWGMDKLVKKAEKPEVEAKVKIAPELPEAKVEAVELAPATTEKKHHPRW